LHDAFPHDRAPMIWTLLLALATSLAETLLWWAASAGRFTLLVALALHGLLTLVLALNIFTVKRERSGILMLAMGTLFMGPFGAVGGVAMALFASGTRNTDFQAYRRALGPDGDQPLSMPVRLAARSGRSLLSFQDVMRWGSRTEKQAALRRMAERYSPAFLSALKYAMKDQVPEIRSEAGAAAQSILKTLETNAKTLHEKTKHLVPGRDNAKLGEALILYGDAELSVARSGLASAARAGEAFSLALAAYDESRKYVPATRRLRLKAAEALFDTGALIEAARESGAALVEEDPTGRALEIHLETLFALGRYADIRRLIGSRQGETAPRRAATMWRAATAQAIAAPPNPAPSKTVFVPQDVNVVFGRRHA